MISEYQRECPACGFLRAIYSHELNLREVRVECPKCGLDQRHVLPKDDEGLRSYLFSLAKKRLQKASEKRVGLEMIHQQLAYILRLLQYRHMFDGDVDSIMAEKQADHDIIHNGWAAVSCLTEESIGNLSNPYFGFEDWLRVGLRSLGFNDEAVSEEVSKYCDDVRRVEAKRVEGGGSPFLYDSVRRK